MGGGAASVGTLAAESRAGVMAPVLTLHQGDEKAGYVPHPMEVAREELLAAADLESDRLAPWLRRVAGLLPKRAPLRKGGA